MKLSEKTIDVLKNFSTINPSVVIKKGNVLKTISERKSIVAQATIAESFPVEFGVYELNRFLGLIGLFNDPEIKFDEKFATIKEGSSTCRFVYTDTDNITAPPTKNLSLPSSEVTVSIKKEVLKKVLSAASQLQHNNIVIKSSGQEILLVATDVKDPTCNEYSVAVGEWDGEEFSFAFLVENIKVIPDDYDVSISSKGISQFKGSFVEYWIAVETNNSFFGNKG